jgi:hypothetical protein
MPFIIMLLFLLVWLMIFWTGSFLLEKTGLDRSRARFQTLSAITGTGFTTTEAEDLVNNTRRRTIITWLIFIGNTGILTFIIAAILYVRAGFSAPSPIQLLIVLLAITLILIVIIFKLVDRLTDSLLGKTGNMKTKMKSNIMYTSSKFEICSITVEAGMSLGDYLEQVTRNSEVIYPVGLETAIEIVMSPEPDCPVENGNKIICFRKR